MCLKLPLLPDTGLESAERYCPALLTIEESRKSDGLDLGRTYHRIPRTTRWSRYYGLEFVTRSRSCLVNIQLRIDRVFIHTRVPNFPLALIHNPFAHNFYCGVQRSRLSCRHILPIPMVVLRFRNFQRESDRRPSKSIRLQESFDLL